MILERVSKSFTYIAQYISSMETAHSYMQLSRENFEDAKFKLGEFTGDVMSSIEGMVAVVEGTATYNVPVLLQGVWAYGSGVGGNIASASISVIATRKGDKNYDEAMKWLDKADQAYHKAMSAND
ncbi:MAG: hypothetical protein K0R57_2592 [Paenibacillaceae bacterium]|nr:hypothetical protein [Paenibacillaceae bacterium]